MTPLHEPREFWGVETTAEWRVSPTGRIGGILAWQAGERETETGETRDISSSDVPPLLLTVNLYHTPYSWWRNRLQLDYRGSRDPFDDSEEFGEGRVDDLLLVNASASFDLGPGELQLGVENLLNEEYFSLSAQASNSDFLWIPEEGTRLSLTYSLGW